MTREDDLVEQLALRPHPEGGFFAEVYRSREFVSIGPCSRSALTAIYFLLRAGEISRWHRVRSDEVWTHVEGSPLRLHIIDARNETLQTVVLGALAENHVPFVVVPATCWQGAESAGPYTLVSCFVAPGFEFEDFALAGADDRALLERIAPDLGKLL